MTTSIDMITVYLLPTDAIKRIKALARERRQPFLCVEQRAVILNDADRYFPIIGHVKVSVAIAVAFIEQNYRGYGERGAQVRITYSAYNDNCVFIG